MRHCTLVRKRLLHGLNRAKGVEFEQAEEDEMDDDEVAAGAGAGVGAAGAAGAAAAVVGAVGRLREEAGSLKVTFDNPLDNNKATVRKVVGSRVITHHTNLTEGTCTCGHPEMLEGLPFCADLVAHSIRARFKLEDSIPKELRTQAWRNQYAAVSHITSKAPPLSAVVTAIEDNDVLRPLVALPQRGRTPGNKRKLSALERGSQQAKKAKTVCSACGKQGHKKNSKKCGGA